MVMSARTCPSPGVSISSERHDTGSSPITSSIPRTRLCQRAIAKPRPPRGPLAFDWPAAASGDITPPPPARPTRVRLARGGEREHRAALAVEISGEHVQDVDEPARERAEPLR